MLYDVDEFCITLHTVDDKRFLCAHQDTADLTLIADQGALSHSQVGGKIGTGGKSLHCH
jgi:hypothetical protein